MLNGTKSAFQSFFLHPLLLMPRAYRRQAFFFAVRVYAPIAVLVAVMLVFVISGLYFAFTFKCLELTLLLRGENALFVFTLYAFYPLIGFPGT